MLKNTVLRMFTKGEVKPEGWIKKQLTIQAQGLGGHLDEVWPDVRDSKWIGGNREGWERVPYWLDGFIPLAWLLDDENLKQRSRKYMDAIIARQEEDGWICPCDYDERRSYDLWSGILIAKVLAMYADFTGETAAEESLYRLLKNMWIFTRHCTLHNWAAMRWFEALIPICWMYERRPEDWMLRLAYRFEQQGFHYGSLFSPFRDARPERVWTYSTHVVNLAMAIKQDALMSRLHGGNPDAFADKMLADLFEHHGMAVHHFTGDECLMGNSPIQGSELCGVVEAMYSYEWLLSVSGNPKWGDFLEKLAFNALPAAFTKDMWAHQYDQMTNQVRCERLPEDHVVFGTNGPESHLYGLEPNYGCCTANFGQGWPKFAMSIFMKSDNGIACTLPVPGKVNTVIAGAKVSCQIETNYPFDDKVVYTVHSDEPVEFELMIRVPGTAKSARINGMEVKTGEFYKIQKSWSGHEKIVLEMQQAISIDKRPRNMGALWRGPLLYSVAIEGQWKKHEYISNNVERKFPYCDYEVTPLSAWNYGFYGSDFIYRQNTIDRYVFDEEAPPCEIEAELVPVKWQEENKVCTVEPQSREPIGEPCRIKMIPYGCAKLRMTEMPLIDKAHIV